MSDWLVTTLTPNPERGFEWEIVDIARIPLGADLRLPVGDALLVIEPVDDMQECAA